MRPLLALVGALLLTASLAGCFERSGTLTINLTVANEGAIGDFSRVNLTLDRLRVDAKTLDPAVLTPERTSFELAQAARTGESFRLFSGTVRADRYDRITLQTPPGSNFQGTLRDGTTVAIVVSGGTLSQTIGFEMPRGGAITYDFVIAVRKNDPGQGQPTYFVAPVDEDSGPRRA